MATGHGGGGPTDSASKHPTLASASASPPYPRRGTRLGRPSLEKQYDRLKLHLKITAAKQLRFEISVC
jgi:hypothetical protein